MRVLVVEDDVKLASLIRKGLRAEGLLADAINGEDSLWMAPSTPYDALTLDLRLSGMDGLEVTRRLRADVYVRCLREKLDRPFGAQSIETVRGAG
jgi:two-component system, OmpR family, response regulator